MQNQDKTQKQIMHDWITRHDQYCEGCYEKIPEGSMATLVANPDEPEGLAHFYCAKCAFGLKDRKQQKEE